MTQSLRLFPRFHSFTGFYLHLICCEFNQKGADAESQSLRLRTPVNLLKNVWVPVGPERLTQVEVVHAVGHQDVVEEDQPRVVDAFIEPVCSVGPVHILL